MGEAVYGNLEVAAGDDDLIIPYTRCFLKGTELTENVTLQRYNEANFANHQDIYNDPDAQKLVFNALRRHIPAKPERVF
jgi:hypothetical protein